MNFTIRRFVMNNKLSLEWIIEVLVAICIICLFFADVFSHSRRLFIGLACIPAIFVFAYNYKYLRIYKIKIIIINIILLIVSLINMITVANITIPFIVRFFLVDQSIALFLLGSYRLTKGLWYIIGGFIYSIVWYYMVTSVDGYQLFTETSRNYASVYSIFVLFIIGLTHYKENTELPCLFVIHNMVLSIYCIGRGGIISACLLLVLYSIMRFKTMKNYLDKIKTLAIFLVFIIISILYLYYIGMLDVIWEKYLWRFYDNRAVGSTLERMWMIQSYIDKTSESVLFFLFGTDISNLSLIQYQKGNIHNSYLMLHKAFGIIGSTVLLSLGFLCYKTIWRNKGYELDCIILTIMVRAAFDSCFPYHILNIPFQFLALGHFCKNLFYRRVCIK